MRKRGRKSRLPRSHSALRADSVTAVLVSSGPSPADAAVVYASAVCLFPLHECGEKREDRIINIIGPLIIAGRKRYSGNNSDYIYYPFSTAPQLPAANGAEIIAVPRPHAQGRGVLSAFGGCCACCAATAHDGCTATAVPPCFGALRRCHYGSFSLQSRPGRGGKAEEGHLLRKFPVVGFRACLDPRLVLPAARRLPFGQAQGVAAEPPHISQAAEPPITIFIYSLTVSINTCFNQNMYLYIVLNQTLILTMLHAFSQQTRHTVSRSYASAGTSRNTSGVSQHTTPQQLENRSYGFKELATLYFPNIAPASASIRLKTWIKESPELLQALEATHYRLTARLLTPLQTTLIADAFGSPF